MIYHTIKLHSIILPSKEVVKNFHMTTEFCVHNTRMQRIDSHVGSLQAFGQFPSKEYVGQLALTVGVTLVVRLLAVQIIDVDGAASVGQAGNVDNATWCRFLHRNKS